MKKLMIAAAIVCAAAMSQAAANNWKSGNLTLAGSADGTFGATTFKDASVEFKATLFYVSSLEGYATLNEVGKITSVDAAAIYDAYKAGDLGTAKKTGSNVTTFSTTTSYGNAITMNPGAEQGTFYGLVVYEYTDSKFGDMYIANAGIMYDATGTGTASVDSLGLKWGGSTGAGSNIAGWTVASVPEPTSGLLLLLGVAGLALRRRRA